MAQCKAIHAVTALDTIPNYECIPQASQQLNSREREVIRLISPINNSTRAKEISTSTNTPKLNLALNHPTVQQLSIM
jgi:hypothetical protein